MIMETLDMHRCGLGGRGRACAFVGSRATRTCSTTASCSVSGRLGSAIAAVRPWPYELKNCRTTPRALSVQQRHIMPLLPITAAASTWTHTQSSTSTTSRWQQSGRRYKAVPRTAATATSNAAATSSLLVEASSSLSSEGSQGPSTSSLAAICTPATKTTGSYNLDGLGKHSYRVIIAYDGTKYCGWQLQPDNPTLQGSMEQVLGVIFKVEREALGVCAAGRTDSGVHAHGQVVQFYTDREPDPAALTYSLNALLKPDIRAVQVYRTAPDFSASLSAIGKTYRYYIDLGRTHNPTTYNFCAHQRKPLNIDRMREAAQLFVGQHDFTQFSNKSNDQRNPVKVLKRMDLQLVGAEGVGGGGSPASMGNQMLRVEVEGAGFLYKQVRHMVGALMAVGLGSVPPSRIAEALQVGSSQEPGAGGRSRGWNVAPAKGLFLHKVHYPPEVDDPSCLLYPQFPHDEWGRLLYNRRDADEE